MSAGDLLFGSIVVWGSERAAYTHQSSSRCHKRHRGTQLVESLLQWTQVCRGFLTVMMQKLPQYLLRTLFHYQPTENWMNCELQGLCAIWHNVDALYVCQGDAQPIFSWLVLVCGVAYGMIGHEINSSSSDPNGGRQFLVTNFFNFLVQFLNFDKFALDLWLTVVAVSAVGTQTKKTFD